MWLCLMLREEGTPRPRHNMGHQQSRRGCAPGSCRGAPRAESAEAPAGHSFERTLSCVVAEPCMPPAGPTYAREHGASMGRRAKTPALTNARLMGVPGGVISNLGVERPRICRYLLATWAFDQLEFRPKSGPQGSLEGYFVNHRSACIIVPITRPSCATHVPPMCR